MHFNEVNLSKIHYENIASGLPRRLLVRLIGVAAIAGQSGAGG